jgi:hypothetical protein
LRALLAALTSTEEIFEEAAASFPAIASGTTRGNQTMTVLSEKMFFVTGAQHNFSSGAELENQYQILLDWVRSEILDVQALLET